MAFTRASKFGRSHLSEICGVVLILAVAGLFLFYQIPRDFGDDPTTSGIVAEAINTGHRLGTPAVRLFETLYANSNHMLNSPKDFEYYGFGLPFWHFLVSITYATFGVSVFDTLVLGSIAGLLTVFVVYLLAKDMYGRIAALLSAILLSTSLLFIILVRSGSGFFALIPLVASSSVYFVYLAHKRMNPRYLWISGVALGLAFFDAYPPNFLLIPIIGLFLVWSLDFRSLVQKRSSMRSNPERPSRREQLSASKGALLHRFLSVWDYFLTGVIAVETFILATIGFDLYVGLSPLTTLQLIREHWFTQPSLASTAASASDLPLVLTQNTRRFFGDMFVSINPGVESFGPHTQQFLAGEPYIAPFVSIFLVVGLAFSIKRRSAADKMCLAWFAISVLAVTIFSGFNARGAILIAPAIAVIAAKGMTDFIGVFKGRLSRPSASVRFPNRTKLVAVSIICFGVILTMFTSYQGVFQVYYGQENGRIARYYGVSGVYGYIMDHSKPGTSQIVLGDPAVLPYDAYIFHTGGAYPMMYWQNSVGLDPSKLIQNVSALDRWEQNTLRNNTNIFYVFGLGGRYTELPGWDLFVGLDQSVTYLGAPSIIQGSSDSLPWFRELHPFLQPVQMVYNSDGTPAFAIYTVDRATPRNGPIELGKGLNDISVSGQSELRLLTVKGPASNFTISVNNGSLAFPESLPPSETDSITWNNESQIVFEPLIQSPNYVQDVFQEQNLRFNSSKMSSWIELNGESGYVIYRLESPFGKIGSVTIQTNPRIYNDVAQKDSVDLSYSVDNRQYKTIYTIGSNGDGGWSFWSNPYSFSSATPVPFQANESAGVFERQTYNEIHTNSNVVYLKFTLSGQAGKIQLWSPPGPNRMYFIAQFDSTSAPRLTLHPGLNPVNIQVDGSPSVSVSAESTLSVHIHEVSCWKLNDGNGAKAADSCGKNAGTLVNSPTWLSNSSCIVGGCLKFVGPAQKVSLNPNSGLPTSAMTVGLWVKVTAHSGGDVFIQNTWASHPGSWILYGDASNWVFGIQDSSGANRIIYIPHSNSTSWNYLVGTWTGGTMALYVNGTLVGTATTGGTTLLQSSLQLGTSNTGSILYEDDLRIWQAALSSSQIQQQYKSYFSPPAG